jgi:ATP-dependent exoDNAse (exonuclease V) alpha subunit
VAEGIRRMRAGEVTLSPGYDGEYGKIHLLDEEEINTLSGQISLFGMPGSAPAKQQKQNAPKPKARRACPKQTKEEPAQQGLLGELNDRQKAAVTAPEQAVIVTAGPGTGKTKTLVARIAWLIGEQKVKPADIAAVTFTNKAADEMRQRLIQHFGGRRAIQGMRIGTFHSLCLDLLSRDGQEITIADENEAAVLAIEILKEGKLQLSPRKFLQEVSQVKSGVIETAAPGGL